MWSWIPFGVREGAGVLHVGIEIVWKNKVVAKEDREMTSVLETQGLS